MQGLENNARKWEIKMLRRLFSKWLSGLRKELQLKRSSRVVFGNKQIIVVLVRTFTISTARRRQMALGVRRTQN